MALKIYGLLLLFLINMLFGVSNVKSQTCSCAGAPLISSQSTGASGAGNLLLGITYEFNEIDKLFNGTDQLVNDSSERNTQSFLIELNYGLTDRLSVSSTITYVDKQRTSGLRSPSGTQTQNAAGLGDGLFMLRYTFIQQSIWNPYHLAFGGGTKLPFGSTSLTNSGLPLNADMQPGTGAWDGVFWMNAARSFLPVTTLNLSLTNSFRLTGSNERFVAGDDYQFGNELLSTLAITNGINDWLGYRINMRYRSTSSDQRNDVNQPNTGGKWLSLVPELNFSITDQVAFSASGQIPLVQNLNGTQPTTTYAISGSIFINLNSKKETFKHGTPY